MTVFRVQSHNGEICNPTYPRRDIAVLLANQIAQFQSPPRISIQLPAHHQSKLFTLQNAYKDTLVIDFRWLGYLTGLRAFPDFSAPYEKAGLEAKGLSNLINALRQISPNSPVEVVAHRFGARVALMAVSTARSKMWRNLLLSNAFEYSARTVSALDCPMGAQLKITNLVARKSQYLPLLFDKLGPKPGPADRAICFGYHFPHSNWTEILADTPEATKTILAMGTNMSVFSIPNKRSIVQRLFQTKLTLNKTVN